MNRTRLTTEEIEQITQQVLSSHQSISKMFSDSFGETKTEIALIRQRLDSIDRENTTRNGSFAKSIEIMMTRFSEMDKTINQMNIESATNKGSARTFNLVWSGIVSAGIALIAAVLPIYLSRK